MNVLAFDTCFSALSVAVRRGKGGGECVERHERIRLETGHAEALMPMIERVMREASVGFAELDRIVVTNGPGTFTGVRTGVAAARALALVTGAGLVGVSSLWAIAAAVRPYSAGASGDAVLVAMDARKGQVYTQVFDAAGNELTEPALASPEQAAGLAPGHRLHLAGNAALTVAAALEAAGRADVTTLDWETLLMHHRASEAAAMFPTSSRAPCAGRLQPLYLRPPDAKPQSGKSLPWISS